MQTQDYLDLVTSEHQGQPNFMGFLSVFASALSYIQGFIQSMIPVFDLDNAPVGDQLTIIGQLVGASRVLRIPIAAAYFSWNTSVALGWNSGVWQGPNSTASLYTLPDDIFLNLVNARILANRWDGTTESAYAIYSQLLPGVNVLIQDNQDMSFALAVQGGLLNPVQQALLTGGYLPLRPTGVQIAAYVLPVDSNPLFAWGASNEYLGGWGSGSWGQFEAAS